MAFTVETGAGLASANSYLSVAGFKSYHDDRGVSYSAHPDLAIQGALVVATSYVDRRYFYVGIRRNARGQALEWPRISAVDVDGRVIDASSVPPEVTGAVAELAMAQLSGPLFKSIDFDPLGAIVEATDQVGSVRRTRRYSDRGTSAPAVWASFPVADTALYRLSRQQAMSLVRG